MLRHITRIILACLIFIPSQSLAVPEAWVILAPGIHVHLFHLANPRPINLYVARLERAEQSAIIDTTIAQGRLADGRETVSGMAARYNQAINFWGQTWGNRNKVVVAINGYYFNLSSGTPLSGQVQSGWYAQRFSDYVADAGFAWNVNRSAFIGKCVYHIPRRQYLTNTRNGEIQKISGINIPRGSDELILYTPQYAASTRTDPSGLEILVEMSRPTLVMPEPAMVLGTVVLMRDRHGNTPIPFDHIVLSASGLVRYALLNEIQVGDEIGISQEISDCVGSPATYWSKTYAATGGDYHFLTGGQLTIDNSNPDTAVPNSRTAIAYNLNYVYFVVVDGWNRGVSEGITITELGNFLRSNLDASDAVSLDSGGSSTMVVNGLVVNNTYCNFTRNCGMQPDNAPDVGSKRSLLSASPDVEALIGNGLMMISVAPREISTAYSIGMQVYTKYVTELRLGPGTNYPSIASLPIGSLGEIIPMHYTDINGVLATGSYWWRVNTGDLSGWVRQEALVGLPDPGSVRGYLPFIRR